MKRPWKSWKNLSPLEILAIKNVEVGKRLILKHLSPTEIISIYLKGSFLRREMNEDSDLDFFVVVKTAKSLSKFKKIKREINPTKKPELQIGGHTLWEMKHDKRIKRKDGKPLGSPSRAARHLPYYCLIYGRELRSDEINLGDPKSHLKGMIDLIRDVAIPLYGQGEWGFANILKSTFWLIENVERVRGTVPPHSWKKLAQSISDEDHLIHDTLNLRLHPTKDQKIRMEYIRKLLSYLGELEKEYFS